MLLNALIQAYYGKLLWFKIRKKYGAGDWPSRYLLFPSDEEVYNAWGFLLMPFYLSCKHIDKLIIIVADERLEKNFHKINHDNLHILRVSRRKMDALIRLAGLINMKYEWTIVSTKQPYNTGAEHLLGKHGVTHKEIVWYDIYQLSQKPPESDDVMVKKWQEKEIYEGFWKQNKEYFE